MRERHVLRAWPLTPIHIGTGQELTPESFVLEGDYLRSFNSFAALAGASEKDRQNYRNWLKSGDLAKAQSVLATLGSSLTTPGEKIAVSQWTMEDLKTVLNGHSIGRGGIRPFIRDGDAVILPGSSLKGAFRTAWIDKEIACGASEVPIPKNPNATKEEAAKVNQTALHIESDSALEQDPFRDVAVADAPIPAGRTRYDRARLGKLDRRQPKLNFDETGGIQMHVERLISLADGGAVAPFNVEIAIAPAAFIEKRAEIGRRAKRIVPARPICAAALWAAANRFHADLWRYERERYYKDSDTGRLLGRLLEAFGLKDDDKLPEQLGAKGLVLLRIGRYGQFESKAVRLSGKRYGIKAQTRSQKASFMEAGGTRTTVKVAGDIAVPFGWLLLSLPEKGPQGAVTVPTDQSRSTARGSAPAPTANPLASAIPLRFRKGEHVVHDDFEEGIVAENVRETGSKMLIDFADGKEELSITGWKRK